MSSFRSSISTLAASRANAVVAVPASAAAWDRCRFVYPDMEFPEGVRELYGIANGFAAGSFEPILGRWAPLPIEPPRWGISWVAPCRPEAQLPIIEYSRAWLTLLLEGEHKGEIWAARHSDPDLLGHAGRVARSLEELFDHLAVAAEGALAGKFVTETESAARFYPGVNTFVLGGSDIRPQEEIKADGGWPPIYQAHGSPEWERAWYELRAREDAWQKGVTQWQQKHFPGQKKTPPPV